MFKFMCKTSLTDQSRTEQSPSSMANRILPFITLVFFSTLFSMVNELSLLLFLYSFLKNNFSFHFCLDTEKTKGIKMEMKDQILIIAVIFQFIY